MHILMIAPEPFFEPRGTPFSEFHRIRALTSLGHTVDLVTYPFGKDVNMPGLRIVRSLKPPFVSRVGIGPSWAKVPLDTLLSLTALRMALTTKYDAIHSHEEGGAIGIVLAALLGKPHLYDMHSSLPQQITNFGYGNAKWLASLFGWVERLMIKRSQVVIVICEDLEDTVKALDLPVPTILIENAAGSGAEPSEGTGQAVRMSLGLSDETPIVLYTGTFEAYQGLGLLFDAMGLVRKSLPDARLVMVGGEPAQVETARQAVDTLGQSEGVIFTGQRPAEEIPAYLDAANALVSPRSSGTNTPLKIYQYLRSGRPIVATRLRTHTQVLNDDVSILTPATASGFAEGIVRALTDPAATDIGRRARDLANTKYSDEAFVEKTRRAYEVLLR
ncbi:MAG: glycosyltransferase family 4 protein [Acidobacteria bacterium]|nr:glycosyltransferase family 4 protein [Acidobacteriota bacterium]